MLVAALRQRILELAIQGKLVPQRPEDGTAEELYQQIQQEKKKLIAAGKLKKQKPLPPITQEEITFDIPESWKWVRLQSICARFSTGPFGSMLHKRDYVPKGIPVVNPTNIIRERIDTSKVQRVGKITCDKLAVFQLNVGDIVLARRGNLSKCAPVGDREKGWLCGTGSFVIHPVKMLSQWLCYYYVSRYSQHYLLADSVGNTMDNLNQGLLSQLPIALPPFSEQQRIVERVQALFAELDAIEQSQERVAAIQAELNKRILERAIQGKLVPQCPEEGTAEDLYQQIQKEKKKLIAAGKLKKEKPLPPISEDEMPFDIPDSWKWVRLGDLSIKEIKRGKAPAYAVKSDVLVFAQKCNAKAGGINMGLARCLDEAKLPSYPETEFMQDGDIVINSTGEGTLGRVGIFHASDNPQGLPIVPDSHVTIVRIPNSIDPMWLFAHLKTYQPYLEGACTGSTNQTELKPDIIRNLLIALPPSKEQTRIAEAVWKPIFN